MLTALAPICPSSNSFLSHVREPENLGFSGSVLCGWCIAFSGGVASCVLCALIFMMQSNILL